MTEAALPTRSAIQHIPLASRQGRWLIAATALGSGMIFLDGTVVNVALPTIQRELSAQLSGLQWIVNSYTLLLAALLMLGGGIGDVYGRKEAFIAGLIIFTAASVGCGLAPDIGVLIAARAIQGVGGALMVPGSLAMIKAVIVPEDSGRAIGLWAGMSGVTTAVGPLLGGYLVNAVSWRAIFFINVPFGLLTLYAMWVHVPPNHDPDAPTELDFPGALAIVAGLGGITFGLIEGQDRGWGDSLVVGAFAVGVLGMVLFVVREARARYPMVPLSVFRSRTFTGANLATLGVYFAFTGAFLFLVLLLQQVERYSPLESGAALLPITLLLLFLSPRVGALLGPYGARLPMTVGPLIIAAGFLLMLPMGRSINYFINLLPAIVVLGVGMSAFVTPLTATVMAAVPDRLAGTASGISNTLTRVASLLAVAVLGLVVAARFESGLRDRLQQVALPPPARTSLLAHADRLADDPIPKSLPAPQKRAIRSAIDEAYLDGFRWDMAICALLCVLSAGISAMTIDDRRPVE